MQLPHPSTVQDAASAVSAYRATYDALAGIREQIEHLGQSFHTLSTEVRWTLEALKREGVERADLKATLGRIEDALTRLLPAG